MDMGDGAAKRTFTSALVAVVVVFSAQQLLTPILAPLSRELGLSDTQLGLIVTTAALTLTIMSPLWGRALDRLGLRTVLIAGLALATSGLAGFAMVCAAGLDDSGRPDLTFALMLATRGVLFGAGLAALPVAALAVAGTTTTTEAERTKAVGLVGAAQGLSLVLGPALGGALAVLSLLVPLYLAPIMTALLVVGVLATTRKPASAASRPTGAAGVRPWQRGVLPLLLIGFLLYLSLGLVQVIIGFLITDRLELDPEATAGAVGVTMVAAGVVLIAVQGVLVPRVGWNSLLLLRTGAPIAFAAFAALTVAAQLWSITLAFALLALGLGLAIPGFTTALSLIVEPHQQGSVAGLVSATTGATFVVGPVLGTALYEVRPVAPILASLAAATIAWLVVWVVRDQRPVAAGPVGAVVPGISPVADRTDD